VGLEQRAWRQVTVGPQAEQGPKAGARGGSPRAEQWEAWPPQQELKESLESSCATGRAP